MSTVKVVVQRSRLEWETLVECELTLDTLSLLTPSSPMSREIREGAGREVVPLKVCVYADGQMAWSRKCDSAGRKTAFRGTSHAKHTPVKTIGLTAKMDRVLSNRHYDALRSENSYGLTDRVIDTLLEECPRRREPLAPVKWIRYNRKAPQEG